MFFERGVDHYLKLWFLEIKAVDIVMCVGGAAVHMSGYTTGLREPDATGCISKTTVLVRVRRGTHLLTPSRFTVFLS